MATVQTTIHAQTAEYYLNAVLYKDGLLQVSASDDVIAEAQLQPDAAEHEVSGALEYMLGQVGANLPFERDTEI